MIWWLLVSSDILLLHKKSAINVVGHDKLCYEICCYFINILYFPVNVKYISYDILSCIKCMPS